MSKSWRKLHICKAELQLSPTLGGGQSFRWKNTKPDVWIGVFRNRIWILSQKDNYISYQCHEKENSEINKNFITDDKKDKKTDDNEIENMLKLYLRTDFDLGKYYRIWSEADPFFRKVASDFYGVRILNQEVTENVFSFICSSNNNIKRISSMLEKLCNLYGDPIGKIENDTYYSFPAVENLTSSSVESQLRNEGFGYRAKFIYQSACMIERLGGSSWLENLKLLPYREAKKELMKLPGIGAKVADCICLMSLGHLEAVPVDTHMFQIASKMHLPHIKKYKTVTDKVYNEIADHYRSLYGNYAGWAHTILFCSDLKSLYIGEGEEKSLDK